MPTLKTELDKWLSAGIIEQIHDATYCSPLVLIIKPDGSLRIAVDYRELNTQLMPSAYNIPNMKDLFQYLAGQSFFSKMDNVPG